MKMLTLDFKGSDQLIKAIDKKYNTKIYFVGGCVRDLYLGKESKDIDLIIPHISIDDLHYELMSFGKVKLAGESFPVIKFKPFDSDMEYDIAIPRKERSIGDSHTDFEIDSNINITLTEDLGRRDFTMNAIAMDLEGNLIDPFKGLDDIHGKQIKVLNMQSFADDPLRMLRCLQFASRFDFEIEEHTWESLEKNAHSIKNILPERILIEFKKAVKGNIIKFKQDLIDSDLFYHIFGYDLEFPYSKIEFVNNLPELLFHFNITTDKALDILKIDNNDKHELQGFYIITESIINDHFNTQSSTHKMSIFNVLKKSPQIINSKLFQTIVEFKESNYPKSLKELEIDGNDLLKFGLKGEEFNKCFDKLLLLIFSDVIHNDKFSLLLAAKRISKEIINERKTN